MCIRMSGQTNAALDNLNRIAQELAVERPLHDLSFPNLDIFVFLFQVSAATVMCSMPGPIINHATPQIVRNSALNFVGSRRIFRTISHYFALFRTISHYFALFRTISHYFTLFRILKSPRASTISHYFVILTC